MTGKRKPFQTQLRRSISEQLRDSTARAWDRLWKNVRERRLAGRCPRDSGPREREEARAASPRPAHCPAAAVGSRHRFSEPGDGRRRLLSPPCWAGPERQRSPLSARGDLVRVGSAPRARTSRRGAARGTGSRRGGYLGSLPSSGRFAWAGPGSATIHPPHPSPVSE